MDTQELYQVLTEFKQETHARLDRLEEASRQHGEVLARILAIIETRESISTRVRSWIAIAVAIGAIIFAWVK